VNNHRQKIIEKLNAENTSEALAFAKTIGII
jgi:DNA-binding CsgD family transcriptional regulator